MGSYNVITLYARRIWDIFAWRLYTVYLGLLESLPIGLSVSSCTHLLLSFQTYPW